MRSQANVAALVFAIRRGMYIEVGRYLIQQLRYNFDLSLSFPYWMDIRPLDVYDTGCAHSPLVAQHKDLR
jgi:hypothetical protein